MRRCRALPPATANTRCLHTARQTCLPRPVTRFSLALPNRIARTKLDPHRKWGELMKVSALLLTLALASVSVQGQDLRQTAAAKAACGAADVHFTKLDGPDPHPTPFTAASGKSLVYIIGVNDSTGACLGQCGAVLKIGLDGQWTGAAWGNSYVVTSVDPGAHHLCASWQAHTKLYSHTVALAPLTAEPGRTYYFAAHVSSGTATGTTTSLTLEPLNEDQAKMLLEVYPLSRATPQP